VLVHFHDIFLPWEYPQVWFEQMDYFWAEQYLLQAFLAFNDSFDVVIPRAPWRVITQSALEAVVPSFTAGGDPEHSGSPDADGMEVGRHTYGHEHITVHHWVRCRAADRRLLLDRRSRPHLSRR